MKKDTPPPEPTGTVRDAEAIKRRFTFGSFGAGTGFAKSVDKLPAGERQIINALRLFYDYRHNGFLLVEALDTCTQHNVNPPAWVLVAINEGLQRFNDSSVSLERALDMTKRHREEYSQYREEQPLMADVQKIINRDPKRRIAPACLRVATCKGLNEHTIEKQYRRMWRGFYDYVKEK